MNSMGNGLGLFISKKIVESCGGEISAHSDGPDLGSVFSFSIKMEPFVGIQGSGNSLDYDVQEFVPNQQ